MLKPSSPSIARHRVAVHSATAGTFSMVKMMALAKNRRLPGWFCLVHETLCIRSHSFGDEVNNNKRVRSVVSRCETPAGDSRIWRL